MELAGRKGFLQHRHVFPLDKFSDRAYRAQLMAARLLNRTHRVSLGPHFSEGSRLLWVAVERRGRRDVLSMLGVHESSLSRYLYGDKEILLRVAIRAEEMLGIPPRSWVSKPARPFKVPAARAA